MRAIWKGAISFGLVTVPIGVYSATRSEEIKFRLLRGSDLSPINYKRVAETDGREVPWDQIVKGYEYEKDRFVVLTDEDFKRVDLESTQTISIMDFVDVKQINPVHFMRPYYLEPQRGGEHAYALLRDVLAETGKAGIAKVVIKTRQHLAALKANGDVLVLELMHFADELTDYSGLKIPKSAKAGKRELEMARLLVDQMTTTWDPQRYTDDYRSAMLDVIEKKIAAGGAELPEPPRTTRAATNVVDLVSVLQQSLARTDRSAKSSSRSAPRRGAKTRAGASPATRRTVRSKRTRAA